MEKENITPNINIELKVGIKDELEKKYIFPAPKVDSDVEVEERTDSELNTPNYNNLDISANNEEKAVIISTSFDTIIDDLGINKYNMRIYAILSLFFLADGAEMIVISLLVSKLGAIWNLSHAEKGFMGSSVFVGFFIGALLSGKIADTKGRKPTFIIGALIVCIFSVASAFAPNYVAFLFLRAINGFGIGMSVPSSSSLAAEITPMKYRSWVLNLVWIFFPFGEIFAVIIAKYVLIQEDGWRYLLAFAGLPSVIAFGLSFFIFESPKFYLATKNYVKAFEGVNRILKINNKNEISAENKDLIIKENEENTKIILKAEFKSLLKKEYFWLTVKVCTIFYIVSLIYYGVVYILPQTIEVMVINPNNSTGFVSNDNLTIFNSTFNYNATEDKLMTDDERNDMYNGIMFSALSEIPSIFITGFLANVKFLGRIKSMAIGFIFSAVSSILCGIFFGWIIAFASMLKFSINIPFGVIYLYVSEAYPTKIRSIALGVTNAFTRLGGISTPIFSQLTFSISPRGPYFMYALASVVGCIVTMILPFETMGRTIN